MNDADFLDLFQRCRAGSEDAARELFDRYRPHVLRVIRRRLHSSLRAKFDSIDFTQDVWASFFAMLGEPLSFESPAALVAYLAKIAEHKVVETFRQHMQTQKFDITRERSLHDDAERVGQIATCQPRPSELVIAEEKWQELLRDQPDYCRQILVMLRDGYTQREIAEHLHVNERTVRRLLKRLRS